MIQEARDHANRLGLVPPFFDQTQYSMVHRDRIEVEYAPVNSDTFSICVLSVSLNPKA